MRNKILAIFTIFFISLPSISDELLDINIGATKDEIRSVLGVPTVSTKDENKLNTWIYENEPNVFTTHSGDFGVISDLETKKNKKISKKMTTLILKFDEDNLLKSYSYNIISY